MHYEHSVRTIVGSAILAGALLATPALAHDDTHRRKNARQHTAHRRHLQHGHGNHGHGWNGYYERRGRARRHASFVVPRRIEQRSVRPYRPYHQGRIYNQPHGHHHEVYVFPVYTDFGWMQRPYYYCEGALYGGGHGAYRGPRLSFGLTF